ncbi:MAG: glycosyltransferase family 2 protein [Rikenellaceae bacterium]
MESAAIVILNWNGEEHLKKFLPSVVEHTPSWVDIVVADNGSTDGSVELLKGQFTGQFAGVKIIELDRNYGFAAGYNEALRLIDYTYYVLLNSDVEVCEGWCEPLFEELRQNPDIGAVSPKILSYNEPSKFEYAGASGGYIDILGYPFCRGRILQSTEEDCGQYNDPKDLFWVSGAAFACRSEVFTQMGGFDSDLFAHMEEIDLCWRMQLQGYRVRIVPQSRVYHLGGGTLSTDSPNKIYLNHRNNLAMLYKCSPPSQRILVAVARPLLDLLAAVTYLLKGRAKSFWAVFRAYGTFIKWHPMLSRKRKECRSTRVAESTHIYKGSIALKYFLGIRKFTEIK